MPRSLSIGSSKSKISMTYLLHKVKSVCRKKKSKRYQDEKFFGSEISTISSSEPIFERFVIDTTTLGDHLAWDLIDSSHTKAHYVKFSSR
ncbi:hypothetical protein CROQUDRAFT_245998 [Cronartium quercuum f. sp. fusiforme G11]|uniref:Uncharacterized protein n=1 Tax=Cronartium quercuum f. sp. fusiforme G11 TaxID=708437 RepID=A0A9P6TFL5_9BASI|nr:hypothetical protein CROQUDRAFT_245998 [Cronartium quercuum f. sp. fusiforme G11]